MQKTESGAATTKTVVITGASRGIGAGIARLFASRRWRAVVTFNTNETSANEVVESIRAQGGDALALRCDTRSESDIDALFAALDDLGIYPDVLVNNAGVTGPRTRLVDLDAAVLREVVNVNLVGVVLCCRAAARQMSTRLGGRGGVIVNLSSTATRLGNPHQRVHYAATKGAIDVLTNGLARELAADGIRVAAVSPGLTLADPALEQRVMARLETIRGEVPMGRPGTVSEVAEGVYWLASDAASYCTGVVLPVAGGR